MNPIVDLVSCSIIPSSPLLLIPLLVPSSGTNRLCSFGSVLRAGLAVLLADGVHLHLALVQLRVSHSIRRDIKTSLLPARRKNKTGRKRREEERRKGKKGKERKDKKEEMKRRKKNIPLPNRLGQHPLLVLAPPLNKLAFFSEEQKRQKEDNKERGKGEKERKKEKNIGQSECLSEKTVFKQTVPLLVRLGERCASLSTDQTASACSVQGLPDAVSVPPRSRKEIKN